MKKEIEEHEDIFFHVRKRTIKKTIKYTPFFVSWGFVIYYMWQAYPTDIINHLHSVIGGFSLVALFCYGLFGWLENDD